MRVLILLMAAWVAAVLVARWALVPWLRRGPGSDAINGILWRVLRVYARLVHRTSYAGQEAIRRRIDPGPLIVVSNHTSSIDPLLIQAACRFEVRWMMATDLMFPVLDPLWKRQRVIAVARDGTDSGPAREAIRHVRDGGAVGIFPEGRLVTPPRQIWPFLPGVGLIVARTRAPVLLVWVRDTPETSVLSALHTPSRARVTFVDLIEFEGRPHAVEIARRLRERLRDVSGWPLNDSPPPPVVPEARLEPG